MATKWTLVKWLQRVKYKDERFYPGQKSKIGKTDAKELEKKGLLEIYDIEDEADKE
jgi:hypothetical protein